MLIVTQSGAKIKIINGIALHQVFRLWRIYRRSPLVSKLPDALAWYANSRYLWRCHKQHRSIQRWGRQHKKAHQRWTLCWHPQRESNSQLTLRRGLLYPFNYGGVFSFTLRIVQHISARLARCLGEFAQIKIAILLIADTAEALPALRGTRDWRYKLPFHRRETACQRARHGQGKVDFEQREKDRRIVSALFVAVYRPYVFINSQNSASDT